MSRILRRPMFKMGGSTNSGIMTGLVDRKGYNGGTKAGAVGQSTREYISEFTPILEEFTPNTRLPLGAVGAALVSGTPMKDALISGYTDFTKRDDARTAGIQKGAVQLGLGQALKDMTPSDKRSQIDLKAREAFGNPNIINPKTGKPFTSYGEAYTYFSMSAADPGRTSIAGAIERSKQNFLASNEYGSNEVYAERHAIANTIVKAAISKDENYTGRKIKIKDGKYKTQGEIPGIYVDIKGNKIIEINPDGTTEERPELTAILKSYR